MAMTFDQRFNNSMHDIRLWTQSPPCANVDGGDIEARNAIVALQAQVEAMQRGMEVMHEWFTNGSMQGTLDQLLVKATDIREPEFLKVVLATAAGTSKDDAEPVRKSGRKDRKPMVSPPLSLTEWFRKFNEAVGISLKHHQVLYRRLRFEQPKIIFLPDTDADHQKIISWTHSKVLDYAIQYGTEEGSEQHWLYIPVAALVEHGLALPEGAEDDLRKG